MEKGRRERRVWTLPLLFSPLCTWLSRPRTADVAVGFCRFWKVPNLRCVDPHCPHRPSERSLSLCSLFFFLSLPLTDCVNSPWQKKTSYCIWLVATNCSPRHIAARPQPAQAWFCKSASAVVSDFRGKCELPLLVCFHRSQTSECSWIAEVLGPVWPLLAPHKQPEWWLERTQHCCLCQTPVQQHHLQAKSISCSLNPYSIFSCRYQADSFHDACLQLSYTNWEQMVLRLLQFKYLGIILDSNLIFFLRCLEKKKILKVSKQLGRC